MDHKIEFKVFTLDDDIPPQPYTREKSQDSEDSPHKAQNDDENKSSEGESPKIAEAPVLETKPQEPDPAQNHKEYPFDEKWSKICKEVISPSHHDSKANNNTEKEHGKVDGVAEKKEMLEAEEMYYFFKVDSQTKRIQDMIDLKGKNVKKEKKPGDPEQELFEEFLELNERKQRIVKTLGNAPGNQKQRRKSCQCNWCGGVSAVEKKLDKRVWFDKYFDYRQLKEKNLLTIPTSPKGQKNKRSTPIKTRHFHKKTISKDGNISKELAISELKGSIRGSILSPAHLNLGNLSGRNSSKTPDKDKGKKSGGVGTPKSKYFRRISVKPSNFAIVETVRSKEKLNCDTDQDRKLESEPQAVLNSKDETESKRISDAFFSTASSKEYADVKTENNDNTKTILETQITRGPRESSAENKKKKKNRTMEMETAVRELANLKHDMNKVEGYMKHMKKRFINKGRKNRKDLVQPNDTRPGEQVMQPPQENPEVEDKKESEKEEKEDKKRGMSERSLTRHAKISSIYGNNSALLNLKLNMVKSQHVKLGSQSRAVSRGGTVSPFRSIRDSKILTQTETQCFTHSRDSESPSHTSPIKFSHQLTTPKLKELQNKINSVRINLTLGDTEYNIHEKYYLPTLEKKRPKLQMSTTSNSLVKFSRTGSKRFHSPSTKILMDIIPATAKSPQDFIDHYYLKKDKKKV